MLRTGEGKRARFDEKIAILKFESLSNNLLKAVLRGAVMGCRKGVMTGMVPMMGSQ